MDHAVSWTRCAAMAAALALSVAGAHAQDRIAREIVPDRSPVELDDGVFFSFGSMVSFSVRNGFEEPVRVAMRAWVFDQAGAFRGTNGYCIGETFDRRTRRVIGFPLEVRGVEARDRVVLVVDRVWSERWTWQLREPIADQLAAAHARAVSGGGHLSMERRESHGFPVDPCPCDCSTISEQCDTVCADTGLAAFTCTPTVSPSCSASCTCK